MTRTKTPKKTTVKTVFQRQGFTGKLYFINLILTWSVVTVCVILTALSGILGITDLSVLATIVQYAFGELGVFTGFFVWKAKTENCRKHKDVNLFPDEEVN